MHLACVLVIAWNTAIGGQTNRNTAPTQSQTTPKSQEPPDETNPPEEDDSIAPKTYAFDPLQSDRCIKIGNFYMHQGTPRGFRAALGRYEDATRYNPSSAEAFFKVAEAEEKLKNKDAARTALQKVISLAPDSKFAQEAKKKLGNKS